MEHENRKVVYLVEIRGEKTTAFYVKPNQLTEKSIKAAQQLHRAMTNLNRLGYVVEHSVQKVEQQPELKQTTVPFPTN